MSDTATELESLIAKAPDLARFRFGDLPAHVNPVSIGFARLAITLAQNLPNGQQKDECLRQLAECRDLSIETVRWDK